MQPGYNLLASLAVLAMFIAAPVAVAAAPAPPTAVTGDTYLWGEFEIAQPDLTSMALSADLYIYRYQIRAKTYNADDIGEAYTLSNKYPGEPSGNAFVTEIEKAVQSGMTTSLTQSFPTATLGAVVADVDTTTLRAPGGSPFDPPVRVKLTATLTREAADLGLGNLSDAAIEAAFSAGAAVTSDFTLKANPGYQLVYKILPPAAPAGLLFAEGPARAADGSSVTIEVDNRLGTHTPSTSSVILRKGGVTAPTAEDIRSTIDITLGEIEKGATGIPVTIAVESDIRALDLAARMPDALPANVALQFLSADGLRALRATGAISDADLEKANAALLKSVQTDVARAFGEGATVTGGLSQEDLAKAAATPYKMEPPVSFTANARSTHELNGADAGDVDLALRIGGAATVDLNLFPANGRATTFTIHPPSIGEFSEADGGTITANGQTATFQVPAGAASFPAKVELRGKNVPTFQASDASVGVTVDLQDLDVTIGKAVAGDFGNLLMELTISADLGVIEVPDDLRDSLPANLELTHLSSDAIRLLVEHGRISEADLVKLEQTLLKQVAEKLGGALGGDIPVAGGLDRTTLATSFVSTPISGDKPIVFKASARVAKPLAGGAIQPQGAIALYTQELPLTLPKLEGLDTLYTVILPRGLAVTALSGDGETERGESADGRDQFTVRPTDSSSQVTVSMAVTPTFVLIKFWPIVLLAVLLLVLIVGTPIALVVRARGKKAAK